MSQKEVLNNMSDVLFWDVDKSQTDMEKYPAFIIQRVLEYGDWQDWKLILSYYGLNRIVDVCTPADYCATGGAAWRGPGCRGPAGACGHG